MIARLGSFLVDEKIGEGGMASVYLARHQITNESVAIKVVRPTTSSQQDAFVREIESHARLVHPNVVCLYDVGDIDAHAETASSGEFKRGGRFIAMELAQGTLAQHTIRSWKQVESFILQALDGLAYAHARGMIHRDLKPENLLCFDTPHGTRIKLADFGISIGLEDRIVGDIADLHNITGTPLYMAPEQINAAWQEYGPWTDTYALGCMAWELVCGVPPFVRPTTLDTLRAHLEAPRPAPVPLFGVPDGFADWVMRAMAVRPEERFRRAADAGRALANLRRAEGTSESVPAGFGSDHRVGGQGPGTWTPTLAPLLDEATLVATTRAFDNQDTVALAPTYESPRVPAALDRLFERRPPVPASWRCGDTAEAPQTTTTGLALFPLRAHQFVGRVAVRNALWEALCRTDRRQSVEVVIVQGARGDGNSALLDWFLTRARELGAGGALRADFHPSAPDPGFRGLVRRLYHAWGMSRTALYEFIYEALPPLPDDNWREFDARALTEVATPYATQPEGPMFEFATSRQKLVLASRLLRRLGRLNLPILVCDNADADPEARALVQHLLDATEQSPCLVVMVITEEALDDDPDLQRWTDDSLRADNVHLVKLEPLNADDHRALVDQLLPLAPGLADDVVSRTRGNPGFTVQLLSDWVERGLLRMGDDGYIAHDADELPAPDDAHGVCLSRMERALRGIPGDEQLTWRMVTLAALLGEHVDKAEWAAVVGDAAPIPLVARAVARAGLGRDFGPTFEFAFGLIVEALRRRADEQGLTIEYNRACATGLGAAATHRETLARQAEHWLAADEPGRALDALTQCGHELLRSGDVQTRAQILERQEAVIRQLDLPDDDLRRVDAALERAQFGLVRHGAFDEAQRVANEAYDAAVRKGDARVACRAKRLLSQALLRHRHLAEGVEAARESLDHARSAPSELCASLVVYGDAMRHTGAFDDALAAFAEALDLPDISPYWQGVVGWSHASILHKQGDLHAARARLLDIVESAILLGQPHLQAQALNELGDISRALGLMQESRDYHTAVHDLGKHLENHVLVALSDLNLAQTELLEGNNDRAAELAQRVGDVFDGTIIAETVWLLKVAIDASDGNWSFGAEADRIAEVLGHANLSRDQSLLAEVIARSAARDGQLEMAAKLRAHLNEI